MNKDFESDAFNAQRKMSHFSRAAKASFAIPESVKVMMGSINMSAQTDPHRLHAIQKYRSSKGGQADGGGFNLSSQTEPNRFHPIDVFTINKAHASMHAPEHTENHLKDIAESSERNSLNRVQDPFIKDLKEPFLVHPFKFSFSFYLILTF